MDAIIRAFRKLAAGLFLFAILLTPLLIVMLARHAGGIWVLGFVGGMLVAPLVGIGALRASAELLPDSSQGFIALIAFGLLAVLVSVAAGVVALVA